MQRFPRLKILQHDNETAEMLSGHLNGPARLIDVLETKPVY
jgi:hypothetical protein